MDFPQRGCSSQTTILLPVLWHRPFQDLHLDQLQAGQTLDLLKAGQTLYPINGIANPLRTTERPNYCKDNMHRPQKSVKTNKVQHYIQQQIDSRPNYYSKYEHPQQQPIQKSSYDQLHIARSHRLKS